MRCQLPAVAGPGVFYKIVAMPHRYDASTKFLVDDRLADWLPLLGRTTSAKVEVIEADLATVTAAADKVLRVLDDPNWLMHIELQSSRNPDSPAALHVYNGLLDRRHDLLVRTMVVLLRRSADSPELTGVLERRFPNEPAYLIFRYHVLRIWEMSVDMFLNGGLGVVPLAPLSAVTEADLPGVIDRMDKRIRQETSPEEVGILWTATTVLMGLRYTSEFVSHLLRGVHGMKESTTYQAIVEEGRVQDRQEVLLQIGRKRFGQPSDSIKLALLSIKDMDRLARMSDSFLDVSSWDDLLNTP